MFNTNDSVLLRRVVLCTDAVILCNCVMAFNYAEVGGHLCVRLNSPCVSVKTCFYSSHGQAYVTDLALWGHLAGPNKGN